MAWSVYGSSFGGLGEGVTGKPGSGVVSLADDTTSALDNLLTRAQAGEVTAQREYWKLVMERPAWYFLCNPEQAKALMAKPEAERGNASPQPLLWSMNGKTMVGVFTSEAAAMETHRQMHPAGPDAKPEDIPPAAMLSMAVPDAIGWLSNIPVDKVSDIVINRRSNTTVAHMPIAMLPGLYEWSTDSMPDSLWDAFIKSVQTANQPQAWGRLRHRFTELQTWWLPADPGGSNTPLVIVDNDKKYLVIATHTGGAERAFKTIVKASGNAEVQPRLGPLPRARLLQLLDALANETNGPKDVAINLGGNTAVIGMDELAKLLRA